MSNVWGEKVDQRTNTPDHCFWSISKMGVGFCRTSTSLFNRSCIHLGGNRLHDKVGRSQGHHQCNNKNGGKVYFGTPLEIVTDQGPGFRGDLLKDLMRVFFLTIPKFKNVSFHGQPILILTQNFISSQLLLHKLFSSLLILLLLLMCRHQNLLSITYSTPCLNHFPSYI